jgi:hypothetical protein
MITIEKELNGHDKMNIKEYKITVKIECVVNAFDVEEFKNELAYIVEKYKI